MTKSMQRVMVRLREMILEHGPHYMTENPYSVHKDLVGNGLTDRKTAGAILCFLVSGLADDGVQDIDKTDYSKSIQKACGFNKKTADQLAELFLGLYSNDNRELWKSLERKGAEEFLAEDFACEWNGNAVWDEGNGYVDCCYSAKIVLKPTEEAINKNKKLITLLNKNPFMARADIHDFFVKELSKYLDDEFDSYCKCDDYYQPVVEDFEIEYNIKEWCIKKGFMFVRCEGDGGDSGYEPKFMGRWY